MVSRAITYPLIAVIAISIFANYSLYQSIHSLEKTSENLKQQNNELYQKIQELQQTLENYKQQNDDLTEKLSKATVPEKNDQATASREQTSTPSQSKGVSSSTESITAVAVRPVLVNDGFFETTTYEGTVMKITVDVRDGAGLALVNTDVPTGVDFQTSAKTAIKVAQKISGVDLSNKDVIFSISSKNNQELQAVDGPSAGAAMTALLTSDLSGKQIDDKVLITGTILPDGTIGRVGGVAEKADAAGKYGAKIFLVPNGQALAHVQSCDEKRSGVFIYRSCTLEEKPLSPIMEEKYGMKVIEVDNIEKASQYFNAKT